MGDDDPQWDVATNPQRLGIMKKSLLIALTGAFLLTNAALLAADGKDASKTDAKDQKCEASCCKKCGDKKDKKDGEKKTEGMTEKK